MKKSFASIFFLLMSLFLWGQVYQEKLECFAPAPIYNFYSSFEVLKDINNERTLQLSIIGYGIELPKYKLSGGLGFFEDSEMFGQYPKTISSYKLINTVTFDSVYQINNITYHYFRQIDKYDSVFEKTKVFNFTTYKYGIVSAKFNLKLFAWKNITLSLVTEPKFIFQIKRIVPSSQYIEFQLMNQVREKNIYFIQNIGTNIFYRFTPHKHIKIPSKHKTTNKFTVFASYSYNIQFNRFQTYYSNQYTSYSFGLLYSLK